MLKICMSVSFLALGVFCLSHQTYAQTRKTFELEKWKFVAEVFTLDKFQPWSTGVLVVESESIKIPTIFSLETPKIKRWRVNPDFEHIKNKWVKNYPRSKVLEIHHYPIFARQGMNAGREAYVWVIADGKILNVELVRQGACTASTMLLDSENEPYILIPKYVYDEIKSRILNAEEKAKAEGLGIWRDG